MLHSPSKTKQPAEKNPSLTDVGFYPTVAHVVSVENRGLALHFTVVRIPFALKYACSCRSRRGAVPAGMFMDGEALIHALYIGDSDAIFAFPSKVTEG